MCVYIYIYVYIDRERERERERDVFFFGADLVVAEAEVLEHPAASHLVEGAEKA